MDQDKEVLRVAWKEDDHVTTCNLADQGLVAPGSILRKILQPQSSFPYLTVENRYKDMVRFAKSYSPVELSTYLISK